MTNTPLFRADHVGSILRPQALHIARSAFAAKAITSDDLKKVENESIRRAVNLQQQAGLQAISDGEHRRTFFHVDFLEKIEGVDASIAGYEIEFRGGADDVTLAPPILSVSGKLKRKHGIVTDDFKFLQSVIGPKDVAKICIPSPSMLHFRGGREGISKTAYPDLKEFYQDLAKVYQEEIAELYKLGCRYIQLDDTNLAYLCDPAHRARVAEHGENPEDLPALYSWLISECLKYVPDDMTTSIHLCRGNHRSSWAAEGGYEPVADVMFNQIDVDMFFLEYDDDRSGSFSPLRFLPKNKSVILGLLCSKVPELESKDDIKRRIDIATEFVSLDQCGLSPQCGFASTHEGNDLTDQQQLDKLSLVVDVAKEIWQ